MQYQDPNLKTAYAALVKETGNEFQYHCDVVDAAYPDGCPVEELVEYQNSKGIKDAETELAEHRAKQAAARAEAQAAAEAAQEEVNSQSAENRGQNTDGNSPATPDSTLPTSDSPATPDSKLPAPDSQAVPFGTLLGRPWQYFVYGEKAYQITNKPGTIRSKDAAGAWQEHVAAEILQSEDLVVPVTKAEVETAA